MEIDGNGNRKTLETPLEASKHTEGGLSLTRARVEEGHCETCVAVRNTCSRAEHVPEMVGAMVVYDIDGVVENTFKVRDMTWRRHPR